MSKFAWITDIHLDHVELEVFYAFVDSLHAAQPSAVLLGGDIAEAPTLIRLLDQLDQSVKVPLYFVLGNHDYYRGSIAEVREMIAKHCKNSERLHYLTTASVITISDQVGLIGHDGWSDGRAGNYENSRVMLNDYRLIDELAPFYLDKAGRQKILASLGDQAAAEVRARLLTALESFERIVFLTHVPPLIEACWHEGSISDDQWAPHFVCQAVGDTIVEVMREHADKKLTVLCGHTHSRGVCHPLPNLEILTGRAEYGFPAIERVLEF
jgi:predicted MPP superfamily phosphohydrolase